MTKFRKLMALAAVSMLGIQLMGAGTAFANPTSDSDCDFGSDNLEITLGESNNADKADVDLYINSAGLLVCKPFGTAKTQAVSTIDSITVEMDDDESDGELTIWLQDATSGGTYNISEWPEFDTFDIDVSTTLYIDGGDLGTGARNSVRVVAGAKTLSFAGTSATYSAYALDVTTGGGNDTIDASKSGLKLTADAGNGTNSIKGGPKNDDLTGGTGIDVIYGNGGNDDIVCGTAEVSGDQGWGGDGLDDIDYCKTAAPGAGDDVVTNATTVTYADLKEGIEYSDGETGGAAGYDELPTGLAKLGGSQGDDVIVDTLQKLGYVAAGAGDDMVKVSFDSSGDGATVYGGAGNDLIVALDYEFATAGPLPTSTSAADYFYGQAGDDILKGKGSDDFLNGGPGKDQAWGGGGKDTCGAEVTNRCEFIKKQSI